MEIDSELLQKVVKSKDAVRDGDMHTAYKIWCELHTDLYKDIPKLHALVELFTDDEVYAITDYGKKISEEVNKSFANI